MKTVVHVLVGALFVVGVAFAASPPSSTKVHTLPEAGIVVTPQVGCRVECAERYTADLKACSSYLNGTEEGRYQKVECWSGARAARKACKAFCTD